MPKVVDSFFSFHNFEHCQDSFLGWLFNRYGSLGDQKKNIVHSILAAFMGKEELKVEKGVRDIKVTAQVGYALEQDKKRRSVDLVIEATIDDLSYQFYVEDKTHSRFSKKQLVDIENGLYQGSFEKKGFHRVSEENTKIVYFSSAHLNPETERAIEAFQNNHRSGRYVFVNRERIAQAFIGNCPDELDNADSLLCLYALFINGITQGFEIQHWRNDDFRSFLRYILADCAMKDFEVKDHIGKATGFTKAFAIQKKTPESQISLVLFTGTQSKRKIAFGLESDGRSNHAFYKMQKKLVGLPKGSKLTKKLEENGPVVKREFKGKNLSEIQEWLSSAFQILN